MGKGNVIYTPDIATTKDFQIGPVSVDFKFLSEYNKEDIRLAGAIYIHKFYPTFNVQNG